MQYIDSHTEGEPTRVVISGGPDLGLGSLQERCQRFARDFDDVRRAVILEPRGSDVLVGALLCAPQDATCAAGVIFFNNHGTLGMCGHGAVGVAVTLAHLGRLNPGHHRLETPVGAVGLELVSAHEARIRNVPSYRYRKDVPVEVEGLGVVVGDIAWGGNWFFLVKPAPVALEPANVEELTRLAIRVKSALARDGITGDANAEIDHVEFFGPPRDPEANSRNFVLCPGGAYDRSPCGTGTSAKLACLAADGLLAPGECWVQESIIGSRFEAHYETDGDACIIPTIRARAYICSEGRLVQHPQDPYRNGIRT